MLARKDGRRVKAVKLLKSAKPKTDVFGKLTKVLSDLTCVLRDGLEQRQNEFDWLKSHAGLATKCDLKETETKIMSAISEFAAKQKAHNDRIDTAVAGLTEDVAELNRKIEELQNNPGTITPEDQALLDEIETRSDGIAAKLEALDALTPPAAHPA